MENLLPNIPWQIVYSLTYNLHSGQLYGLIRELEAILIGSLHLFFHTGYLIFDKLFGNVHLCINQFQA